MRIQSEPVRSGCAFGFDKCRFCGARRKRAKPFLPGNQRFSGRLSRPPQQKRGAACSSLYEPRTDLANQSTRERKSLVRGF